MLCRYVLLTAVLSHLAAEMVKLSPSKVDVNKTQYRQRNQRESKIPANRCILLIGGNMTDEAPLVEYYHPTAECDVPEISTLGLSHTASHLPETMSGCLLPDEQQIVIRERIYPATPPIMYPLSGQAAHMLPLPRYPNHTMGSTSAILHGKCVSCGGWVSKGKFIDECYEYSAGNWALLTHVPHKFMQSVSVVLGDEYYIIGGFGEFYSKKLYLYNIVKGKWYQSKPVITDQYPAAAIALSATEFMVCGGGTWPSNKCNIYHKSNWEFTKTGDMNEPRMHFALVVFGGDVYALGGGGYDKQQTHMVRLDTVEVYNRAKGTWKMLGKRLKEGRQSFLGFAV